MRKKPKSLLARYRAALKEIRKLKTQDLTQTAGIIDPGHGVCFSETANNYGVWMPLEQHPDLSGYAGGFNLFNKGPHNLYLTPNYLNKDSKK